MLNIVANEPSLGMYRIQEHIRKTLPKLEKQSQSLDEISLVFNDLLYGVEQTTAGFGKQLFCSLWQKFNIF